MNQKLLSCVPRTSKFLVEYFLIGILELEAFVSHDMNQKCKTDQANQIHFLQDLTQICTQKYNEKSVVFRESVRKMQWAKNEIGLDSGQNRSKF